jgi:hypothetical protein
MFLLLFITFFTVLLILRVTFILEYLNNLLSVCVVKNFLFSKSFRPTLGSTQPPIQRVPGALSPGVKRTECVADHSPPASAKVKNMRIYTSTPPYAFMA